MTPLRHVGPLLVIFTLELATLLMHPFKQVLLVLPQPATAAAAAGGVFFSISIWKRCRATRGLMEQMSEVKCNRPGAGVYRDVGGLLGEEEARRK